MSISTFETEVLAHLQKLPPQQKHAVLAFVRALATPVGTVGTSLLPFAGSLSITDAQAMQQAIDQDCEQVDHHEW